MANLKISELPVLTTTVTSAVLPVVTSNTTYQITLANLGLGVFPNFVSSPPATSSGAVGDKAGSIAFSASFFYYCVSDYVGVGTQVWQRIAKDATAW
tara:strand:+ start:359 stop:649 length:291 start_codon:yes stop_codon:yes gene_type:complete